MRVVVTHAACLLALAVVLMTEYTSELEQMSLVPTAVRALCAGARRVQSEGAERMLRIMKYSTTLTNYELSYFQRQCMDAVLPIVAPIVFWGCPPYDMAAFFRRMEWTPRQQRILFLEMSRRAGKSDWLALVIALLLSNVPFLEMLGWSLYKHTSEGLGKTVVKWLEDIIKVNKLTKLRLHHSVDTISISNASETSDERIIFFMSSMNSEVYPLTQPPSHHTRRPTISLARGVLHLPAPHKGKTRKKRKQNNRVFTWQRRRLCWHWRWYRLRGCGEQGRRRRRRTWACSRCRRAARTHTCTSRRTTRRRRRSTCCCRSRRATASRAQTCTR
jgi:hypothetical protein